MDSAKFCVKKIKELAKAYSVDLYENISSTACLPINEVKKDVRDAFLAGANTMYGSLNAETTSEQFVFNLKESSTIVCFNHIDSLKILLDCYICKFSRAFGNHIVTTKSYLYRYALTPKDFLLFSDGAPLEPLVLYVKDSVLYKGVDKLDKKE